ncbi:helix-turn-helix domain-containing protein [Saccharopolyspora thermophila]
MGRQKALAVGHLGGVGIPKTGDSAEVFGHLRFQLAGRSPPSSIGGRRACETRRRWFPARGLCRRAAGLSQGQLARLVPISQATISRYESGLQAVDPSTAERLDDIVGAGSSPAWPGTSTPSAQCRAPGVIPNWPLSNSPAVPRPATSEAPRWRIWRPSLMTLPPPTR